MGQRRQAREAALGFLFQMDAAEKFKFEDLVNPAPQFFLKHFLGEAENADFYLRLVQGTLSSRGLIDQAIQRVSENWKLTRMERVDRSVLRLSVFELFFCPETPTKVIIDEAVEMAKKFGSQESSRFVNALLDRLAQKRDEGIENFLEQSPDQASQEP